MGLIKFLFSEKATKGPAEKNATRESPGSYLPQIFENTTKWKVTPNFMAFSGNPNFNQLWKDSESTSNLVFEYLRKIHEIAIRNQAWKKLRSQVFLKVGNFWLNKTSWKCDCDCRVCSASVLCCSAEEHHNAQKWGKTNFEFSFESQYFLVKGTFYHRCLEWDGIKALKCNSRNFIQTVHSAYYWRQLKKKCTEDND